MIDLYNLESFTHSQQNYIVIEILTDGEIANEKYHIAKGANHAYPGEKIIVISLDDDPSYIGWFNEGSLKECKNLKFRGQKPLKKQNRFDLINHTDPDKELMTKHTAIEEQDSSTFKLELEETVNPKDQSKINEIANLKDQLFTKTKHKGQQEQAKKDMAASYREVIGTLKEEISEIITKIDSLTDELKVSKIIK